MDMSPFDEPVPPPPDAAAPPPEPGLFWGFEDIGLFIGLSFLSLIAALLIAKFGNFAALGTTFMLIAGQMLWYVFSFGFLFLIFRVKYRAPFWRPLAWLAPSGKEAALSIVGGPVLAIALGIIGTLLRTPQINLPFQSLLRGKATIAAFAVLVVIVGPVCEELAFRGFFLPVLMRAWGVIAGIVVTGVLFGALHGTEYPDWRYIFLISIAGIVFGWARYRTGSTMAAALMHGAFNATQFGGLVAAQHMAH